MSAKPQPMLAQPLKGKPGPRYVYEPKLDGIRIMVDKREGVVSIYTRTMRDQKGKFPHLEAAFDQIPYDFTLDGEIVSVERVVKVKGQQFPVSTFSKVNGIVGSSPDRAVATQRNGNQLVFVVFDCIGAMGKDIAGQPDSIRRGAAQLIVDQLRILTHHVMLVPRWDRAEGLFDKVVELGGEGLMVKNPMAGYKPGKRPPNTWFKLKAQQTADVVIMCYFCVEGVRHTEHGFKPGEGKYAGQIGAIEFGQYRNGKLVARSRCSGMTDAERRHFTEHQADYIGRVMEIKLFGRTGPKRSFRNPNYVGMRTDKLPEECVWE